MTEHETGTTVTAEADGTWRIVARRARDARQGDATLVVRADAAPAADAPAARLAAGRAWLSLGRAAQAEGDAAAALACAKSGLGELGRDYRPPNVADDTSVKLIAADMRVQDGHLADGAEVTLRMLEIRLRLMAQKHAAALVE